MFALCPRRAAPVDSTGRSIECGALPTVFFSFSFWFFQGTRPGSRENKTKQGAPAINGGNRFRPLTSFTWPARCPASAKGDKQNGNRVNELGKSI